MKRNMFTKSLDVKKFLLVTASVLITGLSYAQPANDECSGAIAVTPSATATCNPFSSSTTGSAMSTSDPSCGSVPASDVWYSFVAGVGQYKVALVNALPTNPNVDVLNAFGVAVYSGTCGTLTEVDCSLGYNSTVLGNADAEVSLYGLTVGATYYVQVWADEAANASFDPEQNDVNFDLCITALATPPPAPVNDLCSGALLLAQGVAATGDNSFATNDVIASPTCGSTTSGFYKGVWYTATPTASGNLTIASCGSSFDTYLRVFNGGSCSGGFTTCNGFNDDGCSPQSTLTFAAVAGTTYYILLSGYGTGDAGTFTITASGIPLPVTMDLLSGKVGAGNKAQLSWNTFSEQNNRGFEIQRSVDGKIFDPAGFVESKGAQGSSKEKIAYTFNDPVAFEGAVFYRLQQTDIDGKKDYSNIIRLSTEGAADFNLVATPNPVKNKISLKAFGKPGNNAYVLVTDMGGRTLQRINVTAETTDIDMSTLANGIYILKYTDASRTQMIKISKQ